RKARPQQLAECRVELDEEEPRRLDALLGQRLGHRPRPRPEFDHWTGDFGPDITRHGACQKPPRGGDGSGRERLLQPRTDEMNFVVEAKILPLVSNQRLEWHHGGTQGGEGRMVATRGEDAAAKAATPTAYVSGNPCSRRARTGAQRIEKFLDLRQEARGLRVR